MLLKSATGLKISGFGVILGVNICGFGVLYGDRILIMSGLYIKVYKDNSI